jgi:L-alanine-DL-glutamate epimerase-like enolase superfamily enzyme
MSTTVRRASARLFRYALDKPVGGSGVGQIDVIIVELEDSDGAKGLGFSYVLGGGGGTACAAAQDQLTRFILDRPQSPPRAKWLEVYRSFNRSGLGPNLIGLAAIDTAMWDLHARRSNVPLYVAMGGERRAVDVYGSGGFNTEQDEQAAADVAAHYLMRGLRAVKPRVAGVPKDAKVLSAVKEALGGQGHIMADANEKCDIASAHILLAVASEIGALFVEEPLPAHATHALRALRDRTHVAIAFGEHTQDRTQLATLMADRTISVIQPDLAMIGGLTPILDLAVVAETLNLSVSPHFLPGLFVHAAAASRSVHWLEDFPLLEPLFDGWPKFGADGKIYPEAGPGHGLALSEFACTILRKAD